MAIHTLANRERLNAQRHVTVYFLSHSPKKGLETKISNAVEMLIHGFDTINANRFMEISNYLFSERYFETPLPPQLASALIQ